MVGSAGDRERAGAQKCRQARLISQPVVRCFFENRNAGASPVQLLQRDFASQDTSDYSNVLYTLVNHLLLLTLVAVLFHTEIKNLLC
jgi:hypothetical protein